MWSIANKTPFAADSAWVIDSLGNKLWLVIVKATFDVQADGRCILSAKNDPVRLMAEPEGELGQSSLRYEADLGGVKPTTDVLVRGEAIVPAGRQATVMEVALRVGSIHKRLRVTGDRVWRNGVLGPKRSDPFPFRRMPIVYERAYGGWDRSAPNEQDHRLYAQNPVGTGFAVRREGCDGMRLPNVEYCDQLIADWTDRPAPAGFNAVDCAWSPRRELAGTYDEQWRGRRFPLWAADFDARYRNAAPADQWPASHLVGGERIEVTGMSEDSTLVFEIPRLALAFRTQFGKERVEHDGQLCTVLIEPNTARVSIAWQTHLVCNRRADELDETLVVEKRSVAP